MGFWSNIFGKNSEDIGMRLEKFHHQGVRARFDHPKGWQIQSFNGSLLIVPPEPKILTNTSGLYSISMTFLAAQNKDFRESPESSLRTYLNLFPSGFENYELLYEKDIKLSCGHFAIEYSYDFQKELYPFRAYTVISIRDDILFNLDINGLNSNKILPIASDCEKIIQSLHLQ